MHCANLDDEAAFALEFPDFDKNPVWKGIQHPLDYLQKRFGHVESYINFSGVQNLALDLRGTDLFLDYYDEDSPASHLLEVSYLTTRELSDVPACIVTLLGETRHQSLFVGQPDFCLEVLLHHAAYTSLPIFQSAYRIRKISRMPLCVYALPVHTEQLLILIPH